MEILETELATYDKELPRLLENEGKYVIIKGDKVIEIMESYADALKIGYERFGLEPFMVKRIAASEQSLFLTRDLGEPCRS